MGVVFTIVFVVVASWALFTLLLRVAALERHVVREVDLSKSLRTLQRRVKALRRNVGAHELFDERSLHKRVEALEVQTEILSPEAPLGVSFEGLEDRGRQLERDTRGWMRQEPISTSFDVVQDRVKALEKDIGDRVEALEMASHVLVDEARLDGRYGGADESRGSVSERAFTRLVRRTAPVPLRRVYEFSVDFDDSFWTQTLAASPEELAYIAEHGIRLRSVTIERWRSHIVIRATVLPFLAMGSKRVLAVEMSTRPSSTVERIQYVYPSTFNGYADYVVLWALTLAPAAVDFKAALPDIPQLLLRLEDDTLTLCAIHGRFGRSPLLHRLDPTDENVFLRVPFNATELTPFRRPDDDDSEEPWHRYEGTAALTCYEGRSAAGVGWELWIHDLEALRDDA